MLQMIGWKGKRRYWSDPRGILIRSQNPFGRRPGLVESDLALRWLRGRSQQGLKAVPEDLQGFVVFEKGFVDLSEAFENDGVAGESLALFHESADDIDRHFRGTG